MKKYEAAYEQKTIMVPVGRKRFGCMKTIGIMLLILIVLVILAHL